MMLHEEPQKIIKAFACDVTAVYKDSALHHNGTYCFDTGIVLFLMHLHMHPNILETTGATQATSLAYKGKRKVTKLVTF